jgi:hypothetical protein
MKTFLFFIIIIFLSNCSKPKTVLICGDHVCVNKTEANQYFEENLTLEVKVITNKKKNTIDLIELNLNQDYKDNKKITVSSKNSKNLNLKKLSSKEIIEIKRNIKKNKDKQKIAQKINKKVLKKNISKPNNSEILEKNVNKKTNEAFDVCKILEKCNIDEISKYLLNHGKNKDFPDITLRQ